MIPVSMTTARIIKGMGLCCFWLTGLDMTSKSGGLMTSVWTDGTADGGIVSVLGPDRPVFGRPGTVIDTDGGGWTEAFGTVVMPKKDARKLPNLPKAPLPAEADEGTAGVWSEKMEN